MTLEEILLAAGLPVISVDEVTGEITMGQMTDEQREEYNNIILQFYNPTEWENIQEDKADIQDIKDNFQSRWDTLTLIENRASFSADQAAQALNFLAGNQKRIMKYIYRNI